MKVAFLGLGVMGYHMAGHLVRAGHAVTAYNRSPERREAWAREFDAAAVASAPEAVKEARVVFACLGDDPDVIEIVDAVKGVLTKGAVFVDHTTASPALARRLSEEMGQVGIGFIDAPVSGGEAGAVNGALSIMCGGEGNHMDIAKPVMDAFAKRVVHIGAAGAGQLCKAVNQICIAGLLQGLSEGVHFADNAGLDIERVLDAISGGAAQSWQMENRAATMAQDKFDFGFAVDWMRKDLRIALEEGRRNGSQLPVTALVDQFYAEIQTMGGGRWDTSSLVRRLSGA